jgi:peptide/nickel transport system ATP-binding protein
VTISTVAPANVPLLDVRALEKVFVSGWGRRRRAVMAVDDVNLTVSAGQSVGLVGESGSGKSTVARLVARLMRPTSGQIVFNGHDVLTEEPRRASRQYRSQVQMIFQDPFSSLNPVHTVGYNVRRALDIHRRSGDGGPGATVAQLLDDVGLGGVPGIADRYPHELSGGQRQRVAIARTLAVRPSLIVADEPTSMLDVSVRVGILNLLGDLRSSRGIGLVLITHDLASARYATNETFVMYAGCLVEFGGSEALIADPKHPYTKLLVGSVPRRGRIVDVSSLQRSSAVPLVTTPGRKGCPFAPRCPSRMEICESSMPGPEPVGPGRWVRCHLYGPGAAR